MGTDSEISSEVSDAIEKLRAYLDMQKNFGLQLVPLRVARLEHSKLSLLSEKLQNCTDCALSEGRRSVVFGSGDPNADVMFVGEAPGAEEDKQGLPFVGVAGQLLTRMIESIGFRREDVYIANVIKCRPPGNRDPKPIEVASCEPFLKRQIELIRPSIICSMGRFASQTLLKTDESMGRLRGRLFEYEGIKLLPTYHPAALLRNPQWKRPTWEDLRRLRREYDGTEI
jgi:uracil-DNA glycosylase family 4